MSNGYPCQTGLPSALITLSHSCDRSARAPFIKLWGVLPPLHAMPSLGTEAHSVASVLTGLRALLSTLATYACLVAYADRPRGGVTVDPQAIRVEASTVPGAGLGLFAARDLPRDTVLGTYPGVVVPLQQHLSKLSRAPECEGYVWRFSDNQMVIDPTNADGVLDDACGGGNPAQAGSEWLFRRLLPFWSVPTALCRINEPPRGRDVNVVTTESLAYRTVTFALERDVAAGEEFFIDYGLYYDRSRYGKTLDS